ncbi:SIMPL domain-containing protein [Candidatus Darwinibacter acetoxidans]|nr:SIMPL domain-containing protein [Bacillota bacterium]
MRKYLLPRMASVLLLVLLVGALLPHTALANSQPASIQVTGTAVVTATPDIAYITLGVETQDLSADKAAQENANLMAQVLAALEELGLTEKELATSGYNIYGSTQVINRGTDKEETVTTYWVTNRINITTRDLDSIGEIVDRAVKAGANQVQGITFDVEDKQAMQLEALKNAVRQGMAKAEAMAEAAGLTLGALVNMSESYSSYAPLVSAVAYRAEASAGTSITAGDVEVSATVQMEFTF